MADNNDPRVDQSNASTGSIGEQSDDRPNQIETQDDSDACHPLSTQDVLNTFIIAVQQQNVALRESIQQALQTSHDNMALSMAQTMEKFSAANQSDFKALSKCVDDQSSIIAGSERNTCDMVSSSADAVRRTVVERAECIGSELLSLQNDVAQRLDAHKLDLQSQLEQHFQQTHNVLSDRGFIPDARQFDGEPVQNLGPGVGQGGPADSREVHGQQRSTHVDQRNVDHREVPLDPRIFLMDRWGPWEQVRMEGVPGVIFGVYRNFHKSSLLVIWLQCMPILLISTP